MKYACIVLLLSILMGCSALKPVYEFYAHRHAVPMFGKVYQEIDSKAPNQHAIFNQNYESASSEALKKIELHRKSLFSPGISAAVAIDGQLVWAGSAGWANLERQKAMTPDTQFRIGSTSKSLTAALLAKMVESNKLDLDAPISNYSIGRMNPDWLSITPRQLASHTSGIPHYDNNTDWSGIIKIMRLDSHYDDVVESIALFDSSDALFSPGESFEYSSLGTVLLSAVMQQAYQQNFHTLMKEHIFTPLNMHSTMAEPEVNRREELSPNLARFYWHPQYHKALVAPWRDVNLSHRLAGGGFISTPSDLVKLGLGFNSPEFISSKIREEFWTPQTLHNGQVNEQNYGLGWRVSTSDFGEEIGELFHANHGGVSKGAQSWLMVIPEFNMSVAVNINSKTEKFWDFASISYELVKIFIQARQLYKNGENT